MAAGDQSLDCGPFQSTSGGTAFGSMQLFQNVSLAFYPSTRGGTAFASMQLFQNVSLAFYQSTRGGTAFGSMQLLTSASVLCYDAAAVALLSQLLSVLGVPVLSLCVSSLL